MVTSPQYLNNTAIGDINRASVKNARKLKQGKHLYFRPATENEEENETGNHITITLDEAARLLNVSSATVRLWSDMGVLHTSLSSKKHRMVRRAEVLTFLPEENRLLPAVMRTNKNSLGTGLESQYRRKLAEIHVQAIAELTKQSVYRINHLC